MLRHALVLALFLAGASGAWASVVLKLSVEQMTEKAALVIHGTVLGQHADRTRGGRIVTTSTVVVAESLKGSATASVDVRTQGGVVGGIGQQVAGEAQLKPGEEVVLFLRPTGLTDSSYAVLGLAQGKFAVTLGENGAVAAQDLSGLDTVSAPGQAIEEARALALPVAELKARVARAVGP